MNEKNYQSIEKNATVVDVNPMDEKAIRQYISQTIESEGYTIRSDAFDLLLQLTDLNLSKIMGELQKLYLYALETKTITRGAVQELVPKSLEHNVFDLTNEVLSGNSEKAVQLYEDLLLQGEETIKLNAILLNQIRLFLQTKILAKMGYQQANIADTLKVHPYRVKLALQQVRRFELSRLERLYDELVENDYRMKTGQMDKELLFQLFILKLTASKIRKCQRQSSFNDCLWLLLTLIVLLFREQAVSTWHRKVLLRCIFVLCAKQHH